MPAPMTAPNTKSAVRRWMAGFAAAIALGVSAPLLLERMHGNGLEAYDSGRFPAARLWLVVPAALGNNTSQALLGAMYVMALGGPRDTKAALYWLERAAAADLTEAQTMLGTLYATGTVTPREPARAIFWLSTAARHGDAKAAQLLHTFYPSGAL